MPGKRTVSLITAVCISLTGLLTVPSFVLAETATAGAEAVSSGNITAVTAGGTATMTSGSAICIIGAAASAAGMTVTTGAAFNAGGTLVATGTAIDLAGSPVKIVGAALNATGLPIEIGGSAVVTTGSSVITTSGAVKADVKEESLWYLPQIAMKKDHQKLLWDYCRKRGLDYIDMLALVYLESNFYEKCSSGRYKGYFQIGSGHFKNLAATLKTPNKPLDGAININWGTAMYSWILADKRVNGLEGKKLRDAALSIYQRGTGGYDRYGINKTYLVKYYKKRDIIVSYFEKNKAIKDRSE